MSVGIREVIEAGGYNLNTVEDARWLLTQDREWMELLDRAGAMVDEADEY